MRQGHWSGEMGVTWVGGSGLLYGRYMGVADAERRELADLFDEVGPDAPTLCEGWQTRDLAAHLIVREHRLDAAPGILIKALAPRLERIQNDVAAKPWPELVDTVRQGPPVLSPYRIGVVNELVNTAEYFVHAEDVRRAQPEWEPRPADPDRDAALWTRLKAAARMFFRRSPVGVALARPGNGDVVLAKRGPRTVTISGEPGELLLFAFGRKEHRLSFDGEQADVAVVQGLNLGL